MTPIRKAEVEDLLIHDKKPCITFILSPGVKELGLSVQIAQYRAFVREAEKKCEKYHLGQIETEELFAPLKALENDTFFWQENQYTILIFRNPDTFGIDTRKTRYESRVIVDDTFHIRHFVSDLDHEVRFHTLVIAQNTAVLYRGDTTNLQLIEHANLTQSKKEITEASDNLRRQFHTGSSPNRRGSGSIALFSGAGEDNDEARQDQLRFLKKLDDEVLEVLGNSSDPMLLVGVEETLNRYKKISDYPNILNVTLRHRPEHSDLAKLHQDVLKIVDEHHLDRKEAMWAKIVAEADQPDSKVVAGYDALLKMADEGRIDTLFIAVDQPTLRGYYDAIEQKTVEDETGEDLLERLVRNAMKQGAHLYSAQETIAYLRY